MMYATHETVVEPVRSVLPALAILLPVAGAAAAGWAGEKHSRLRGLAAVFFSAATFAVCLALLVRVFDQGTVACELGVIRLGEETVFNLGVDALGAFFGLFASFLWLAASLHAFDYLHHEQKRTRFYVFMLLTEAATLGVFFVQDFFSLFVFFEAMGLLAFMLVVHNESDKARAAAIKYMYMTVVGGLSLLGGIWLYFYYSGGTAFIPTAGSEWLTGPFRVVALVFLIAGFGVKAGMVPLHVWLPDAHPAAPSPASALLSGVMIKAGAYGILRVILTFMYSPAGEGAAEGGHAAGGNVAGIFATGGAGAAEGAAHAASGLAHDLQTLGFVVIWLGIATMFTGMVLALFQDDVKRTLAYSSVSQMGYILLGLGCLAYLGAEGSLGMAGALYHILNHALFKGCFFLAAGSLLFRAHELDMFKLGGLWRKMPVTCILWCVAALGIMGITLFGGFVSKTLLHHAIVESHVLAVDEGLWSAGAVKLAEWIFIITSGGTIAYITKMTYYVFFRRPVAGNRHVEEAREAPPWMLAGTALLAAGVLFCGLFPGVVLKELMVKVLSVIPGLEHAGVAHLGELPIFTFANIKQLFIPLAIGVSVFVYGARRELFHLEKPGFDFFHLRLPAWVGVDYWYREGAAGFLAMLQAGAHGYAGFKQHLPSRSPRAVLDAGAAGYARFRQGSVGWVKAAPPRLARAARSALPEDFARLGQDISLGPLMVTIVLLLFLITKLL